MASVDGHFSEYRDSALVWPLGKSSFKAVGAERGQGVREGLTSALRGNSIRSSIYGATVTGDSRTKGLL